METHFPNSETASPTQSQLARERVVSDLKVLARDADELLRATAGDLSEKAREARARLTSALERAKTSLDEIQTQGMESARVAMQKADTTIRQHPYESLGVAFGLGLLVGVLFRRR